MARGGVSRSYANVATLWACGHAGRRRATWSTPMRSAPMSRIGSSSARAPTSPRTIASRGAARVLRIVALRDEDGTGRFLEIDADERID